jgi:hypothetical protein
MSSIQKFTEDLKRYVAKAQAIEKDDPHKAVPHYLKIAEFIMAFIKQPNLSESFKFTMKKQVNNIIKKVEEINATPNLSPKLRAEIEEKKAKGEILEKEIDESDLLNLPDVPTDEENAVSIAPPTSSSGPIQSTGSSDVKPSSTPVKSNTQDLSDMDALSAKIDFLKEITPLPFSEPITPFNKEDVLKRIKEDTGPIRIDDTNGISPVSNTGMKNLDPTIPTSPSPTGLQIGPNIGFAKDKISASINKDSKKDPFSSGQGLNQSTNPNEKICFACGNPLKKNEEICSVCGANNPN